jgi:CheY-like chemotaxis protein
MPDGGNLELRTENAVFGEKDVTLAGIAAGRYVVIVVTDDGVGMDRETLERIFEPFFTTKPKGMGSGLGLASAYGIVKNHGGAIHADSEPGRGTTIKIYLPASGRQPVPGERRDGAIVPGRRETILVVDDEQVNISVMLEMLEMLHYRVLPAGSGQEAIATYMEKKGEIDLVIMDMIMPGISGGRTFDLLREINPEVDVILASGYSVEGEARMIINRGCRGFIQKPFQMEELSRKVRDTLDNRTGRQRARAEARSADGRGLETQSL